MPKRKKEAVTGRRAGNIMTKIIRTKEKQRSTKLHTKLKIE